MPHPVYAMALRPLITSGQDGDGHLCLLVGGDPAEGTGIPAAVEELGCGQPAQCRPLREPGYSGSGCSASTSRRNRRPTDSTAPTVMRGTVRVASERGQCGVVRTESYTMMTRLGY